MTLEPLPPDLHERVLEATALLDSIEQRLGSIEASAKAIESFAPTLKLLRHDFNNARTIINTLMMEVDVRAPPPIRRK